MQTHKRENIQNAFYGGEQNPQQCVKMANVKIMDIEKLPK